MNNWEDFSDLEKACTKELSEQSLEFYSRAMFRFQEGSRMKENWHIGLICEELQKIETGETENLIINLPPGGGKTHIASVCFPSRGIAIEPRSRYLVVSYSNDLVKDISTRVRDLVFEGDEFQQMWNVQSSRDSNEKSHWQILNSRGKKSGAFKCASSGGSITGFRAGKLHIDKYYGCLIMDDPNKPADMLTERKRANSNEVWNTIRTRLASPKTPIVLIQQRLHDDDATGCKLAKMKCVEDLGWCKTWVNRTGGGKKWKQIIIPALIDDEFVAKLPQKWRNRVTGPLYGTDSQGRYSYWPEKETLDILLDHESSNGFLFASHYMQSPVKIGGDIFSTTSFEYYNNVTAPKFEWRGIVGDCAMKAKQHNDFTVYMVFGVAKGKLYIMDIVRGRWESPMMRAQLLNLIADQLDPTTYPEEHFGKLRGVWVEDAASGTGLVQEIRHAAPVPINPYKPSRLGKWAEAQNTLPFLNSEVSVGRVYLNENMGGLKDKKLLDFVAEACGFTADDSHDHDDQLDCLFMSVSIGLRQELLGGNDSTNIGISGEENVYVF